VKFNVQGLEAILINSNAEQVSTIVSNETPTGAVNSSNKDFVTLNPGVGLIDSVTVASTTKLVGKDFDISQLNEPTIGAKITFKTAPATGQAVKVWYRYWKQDQKIENLVTDLLTVSGVQSGAYVQQVTFPGGVGDSFTIDSQSDWSMGTTSDGDITRAPGDLRIKMDASSNYELLDNFSDGNFTSNPTWTIKYSGNWTVVSNAVGSGGLADLSTSSNKVIGYWKVSIHTNSGYNDFMWTWAATSVRLSTGYPGYPIGYYGDAIYYHYTGGTYPNNYAIDFQDSCRTCSFRERAQNRL
jgi:hypothetical protein